MRIRLLAALSASFVLFASTLAVVQAGATPPLGVALAKAARNAPALRLGFAKESLDPDAADIAAGTIHLGGYGIFPTRSSTGPLTQEDGTPEHLYVRAMAIRNKAGDALLLADLENQGTFASYKQCACGIWDVRQQVASDLKIPVESIVVNSDH